MKFLDAVLPARSRVSPVEERWGFDPRWYTHGWGTWSTSSPKVNDNTFRGLVDHVHRENGIVAAAVVARADLMSQTVFRWRRTVASARAGEVFYDSRLKPLENPVNYTAPSFLALLEHDVSYAGNAYVVMDASGGVRRLQPDRVSFVMRSDSVPTWQGNDGVTDIPHDATIEGIMYHPTTNGAPTEFYGPGQYAHWMPEPDPVFWWRGVSWVTSVYREIATDTQTTEHINKYFENAATPNLVFSFPPERSVEEIKAFADVANVRHVGTDNAWRNMFLAGGADVNVVGTTMEQLGLGDLTSGAETRIAARARIPGVVLGIREGYGGSSLNAGNYGSARRLWADTWYTPHTRSLCAALEKVLTTPHDACLTTDPDEVMFLQEDRRDAAEIDQMRAATIRTLIDGGFTPESVIAAVTSEDMSKLEHTGLSSVQLLPVGEGGDVEQPDEDDSGDDVGVDDGDV